MWRLVAIGSVGLAIASASVLLPPSNGEEQLRSLTHIATRGTDDSPVASAATSAAVARLPAGGTKPLASRADPLATLPTAATADLPLTNVAADGPEQDAQIVLQLQQQLRRVGCFKGKLHGRWDAGTRRAMARFNDRVNARMALDSPNPILLTLVEKYDNRACGTPCNPGTSPNALGQCVSTQIVAAAAPLPALPTPAAAIAPAVAASAPVAAIAVAAKMPEPPKPVDVAATAIAPAKPAAVKLAVLAAPTQVKPQANLVSTGNDWAPTIVVAPAAPGLAADAPRAGSVRAAAPKTVAPLPVAKPVQSLPRLAVVTPLPKSAASALALAQPTVIIRPASTTLALNDLQPAPPALPLPSTTVALAEPVAVALAAPADAPLPKVLAAPKQRKTTIAIVATPKKKKYARKSSASGNTQFALGGPVRPRRHANATSWLTALFSGQMFVSSNRFVARPRTSLAARPSASASSGGSPELQIVLSNH